MNTFYFIKSNNGDEIVNTFPPEIHSYTTNNKVGFEKAFITLNNNKYVARIGTIINENGILIILSTKQKHIKKIKLFKNLVDSNANILESIKEMKDNIINKHNTQTEELIHNLTSLNSYNIQDIFSLIPQQLLTKNINYSDQLKTIKTIIDSKPNVTINTILRIIKNNLAMKIEFSVFEKTMDSYPSVSKIEHDIREILVSILQIFIHEFEEKNIMVSLEATQKKLNVDYDTLSVSLYFIIENAVKYCLKGSRFKVKFLEESDNFSIVFDMVSLKIEEHEIEKLSTFGYRAKNAKEVNVKGKGIGMFRVQKTLKLNDSILEILPRVTEYRKKSKNLIYENNIMKIKFLNQQNWFQN